MSAKAADAVRIRCAADLFSVLSDGPMESQLAVLQSIVADPRRPLALGPHLGEDFVDLLIRLVPDSTGAVKQAQILCLMSYQDPRTAEFMEAEFARSRDAATVLRLGRRLDLERGTDFFRPFLWEDKPAQALAAARLCSQNQELSLREQLRVAILLDSDFQPPAIAEDTMEVWLGELKGKHRLRARSLAERSGTGMLGLWSRWSELAAEEQLWLATATAGLDPELLRQKLASLLEEPTISYAMVKLADLHKVQLPRELLQNEDPEVRAAAIRSGHGDEDLQQYLGPRAALPEVLAAAPRCTTEGLLVLLADERWQVRAVATDLLARVEEPPFDALRAKLCSDSLGERVAAIEVLRRLGKEEWLEEIFQDE